MNLPIVVSARRFLRLVFPAALVFSAPAAVTNVAWHWLGKVELLADSGMIVVLKKQSECSSCRRQRYETYARFSSQLGDGRFY